MELKQLLLVLISVHCAISFAENHKCRPYLVDFNQQHLSCLKEHVVTKSIGINLSRYSDLAEKKYLVIGLKEQPFGGLSVLVLFENEPYPRQLWLYPIEKSEFQLRDVKLIKFSKQFMKQMLKNARNTKYKEYWQK